MAPNSLRASALATAILLTIVSSFPLTANLAAPRTESDRV